MGDLWRPLDTSRDLWTPLETSGDIGLSREAATGLKVTYICRQQKELEGDDGQLDYGSGEVTKALQTNNTFTYTLQPTVLR